MIVFNDKNEERDNMQLQDLLKVIDFNQKIKICRIKEFLYEGVVGEIPYHTYFTYKYYKCHIYGIANLIIIELD